MENMIHNELIYRGYNVDVGVFHELYILTNIPIMIKFIIKLDPP